MLPYPDYLEGLQGEGLTQERAEVTITLGGTKRNIMSVASP